MAMNYLYTLHSRHYTVYIYIISIYFVYEVTHTFTARHNTIKESMLFVRI